MITSLPHKNSFVLAVAMFSILLGASAAEVRGQSALDGFDPNANGAINVVVVQPDGKILIGGAFTTLSPNGGAAVTLNRIARLNPDGTLDTAFNPNANNTVWSIALQADGKILAGGDFNGANSIGGQARNRIARLAASVATPLSLRGPHPALAVTPEEAATWSLEEGAFYGYYFSPAAQPMMALACRGRDQAAGEIGGLINRDCAEPDPLDPTKTQCGFTYAGDCGVFAPTYACELFSALGFYDTCHDQPISEDDESRKFRQVITVFVLP
jgi:hypothetical protein